MPAGCLTAPNELPEIARRPFIFLAGGISKCPDWQALVAARLRRCLNRGTILNPRRENYPALNPTAAEQQIAWEFQRLWDADVIAFWFCKDTLNPITLFEYGAHLTRSKLDKRRPALVVGVEPGYLRESDVRIQTQLAQPALQIVNSLESLVLEIIKQCSALEKNAA